MPNHKKPHKSQKKRQNARNKHSGSRNSLGLLQESNRGYNRSVLSGRGTALDPFPQRCIVKHAFGVSFIQKDDITVPFQSGTETGIYLNDIFAPGGGGLDTGAHQPYGRDSMALLYGRYKVHRCRIRLEVQCSAGGAVAWFVTMIKNPAAGGSTSGVVMGYLSEDGFCNIQAVPQSKPLIINRTIDIARAVEVSKQVFRADNTFFAAPAGSSPTTRIPLFMNCCSAGVNFGLVVRAEFEYETEWFDRIILGPS